MAPAKDIEISTQYISFYTYTYTYRVLLIRLEEFLATIYCTHSELNSYCNGEKYSVAEDFEINTSSDRKQKNH